jgi:hypothetical protein
VTPDDTQTLERLTFVTPLGLRFRDAVTGAVIDEGLSVTAYPPGNPKRRVAAFTNRKGVYVFQGLPGLREAENSTGDAEFWSEPPKTRPFIVEVRDELHRFVPFTLKADAPIKGLYRWSPEDSASPPARESPVLLYSSASRPVLPSMAVVRAELWDPTLKRAAAWALVDALIDGEVQGRGIADEKGRLLLMFPYPEYQDQAGSPPVSSPPSGGPTRLADRSWLLELRAHYSPTTPVPDIPDLESVFEQEEATLWSSLSPNAQLDVQTLSFGSELVLASRPRSELWITPLSSPL